MPRWISFKENGARRVRGERPDCPVSGLLWDDVKGYFDLEWEGCLPDVRGTGTAVEDWVASNEVVYGFDLIAASGRRSQYSEGDAVMPLPLPLPLPRAGDVLPRHKDAGCAVPRVWPTPDAWADFRLESAGEIGLDVDLRELQAREPLDVLCLLPRAIGRRLGTPVVMTPEGDWDRCRPVLGFDAESDRVVLLANPGPADRSRHGRRAP
ncbi:hypothetical protein [Streptomyces sp. NPDC058964]|uniref:hypothetical protein n=1 Tax=Streptomyces sp. NPDC058964 TaxID=3346681 RepID=UPI0036B59AA2